VISPTMTAVLIIPFAFSSPARDMVRLCLRHRNADVRGAQPQPVRSSQHGAGSMYAYTARGLGPTTEFSRLDPHLVLPLHRYCRADGFSIFSQQFLSAIGARFSRSPGAAVPHQWCVCWFVAYRDSMSRRPSRFCSKPCRLLYRRPCVYVLFKHGFAVDTTQLKLKGLDFHGLSYGIVASVFSLVGFESATALGGEAQNPLRNVPKAVIWSLVFAGLVRLHELRRSGWHPQLRDVLAERASDRLGRRSTG